MASDGELGAFYGVHANCHAMTRGDYDSRTALLKRAGDARTTNTWGFADPGKAHTPPDTVHTT